MARLLYRIGGFAARMHWLVIAAWVLLLGVTLSAATMLGGTLQASFSIPGTPSQVAIDMLSERFPAASGASADVILEAPRGTDIHQDQAAISQLATQIGSLQHVSMVRDPFASGNSAQISKDNRFAYISVGYDIPQTSLTDSDANALTRLGDATASPAGLTVAYSGLPAPAGGSDYSQESAGLIVAFVILAITFGSLLAAGMPPVTALIGVGIGTGLISVAAAFAPISSTAPVLASMLGLAVGIDYALFILSRHRSQLAHGMPPRESVAQAVATAGSAVIFAGLTVIIALLGLAVVGIPFITIMGQGAALAVVVALLIAVTLLPAFLGLFGRLLVPKPTSRAYRREQELTEPGSGRTTFGARWAGFVTAKPLLTAIVAIAGLGVLSVPAVGLQLTLPDAGYDPEGTQAREAYDLLSEGFGPGFNGPLLITADISRTIDIEGALTALHDEFGGLPGVAAVSQAIPNQALDMAIVSITPASSPDSEATKQLVSSIRAMEPAFEQAHGFGFLVTGNTAVGIDISDRLEQALIPFALVVVGLCVILLMIVFRSIAVPVTATIGFLLSVGASFGVTTAIFNWGWLAPLVGVDKVGPVISFMPILVMAVLFGLAMDYEVFLVSRMREEFTRTGDASASVRRGFAGAARVVTAAALIMFAVFASFVPGGGAVLQPIALALAVGVLVDAFVVRMTLIPAVMLLLGRHAWWLPRWLGRILPDVDIEGEGVYALLEARRWSLTGAGEEGAAGGATEDAETAARPAIEAEVPLDADRCVRVIADAGDIVVLPPAAAFLLDALTGRVAVPGSRIRVLGLVSPYESALLRGRTARAVAPGGDATTLTVDEYLRERVALDAPRGQRRRRLDVAYRFLEELGRVETSNGGWQGRLGMPVAQLRPQDGWRLGATIALASGRPLVALDAGSLDRDSAAALIAEACALASPETTILVVAHGPLSLLTPRAIVPVAIDSVRAPAPEEA